MFTDNKNKIVKIIFSGLIYRFNTVLIKILKNYFVDVDKLSLRFIWKDKRHRISNIWRRKKVGGQAVLNFKTYYKSTPTKTA